MIDTCKDRPGCLCDYCVKTDRFSEYFQRNVRHFSHITQFYAVQMFTADSKTKKDEAYENLTRNSREMFADAVPIGGK